MVAPCAKRQTVRLRTRRLGCVKGQEVLSSIPCADRFWTHPVAYARLPGATATTKKCPKWETDHQHPSVAKVKHALRFWFPRHMDDLACNLLYIAVFICDIQKITKFYVITAHFRTSNTGQRWYFTVPIFSRTSTSSMHPFYINKTVMKNTPTPRRYRPSHTVL